MGGDRLWGGIDLGQNQVSVCITDQLGDVVLEADVEAKPQAVFETLNAIPLDCLEMIGVEAGTGAHLIRKLRSFGVPIAVLEARKASKILALRRHKTDTNDARGLADIVRLGGNSVTRVHDKSAESRRIRMILTVRQQVIKQRVAAESLIRSLVRENGGDIKRSVSTATLRVNVAAALSGLVEQEGIDLRSDVLPLLSLCESMRLYEEATEKRLKIMAREHPICRRFLDVPGIGPVASLSFFSAVDDPHRFTRTEDIASFLGLTPRFRESGKKSDRPRISKMGNVMTRTHLIMSAEVLINVCKKDSTLRHQALALKARVGFRKARIAVARKLSIVLLSLWKSGSIYQINLAANPVSESG